MNDLGNGVWSHIARDRDTDDDGLIEISNLGQLHAMRWDADGDGSSGNPDYYSTLAGKG